MCFFKLQIKINVRLARGKIWVGDGRRCGYTGFLDFRLWWGAVGTASLRRIWTDLTYCNSQFSPEEGKRFQKGIAAMARLSCVALGVRAGAVWISFPLLKIKGAWY